MLQKRDRLFFWFLEKQEPTKNIKKQINTRNRS